MEKKEKVDWIIILTWPVIASLASILLEETNIVHQNFFISIVIFLALPSIYISFRASKYAQKALILSFLSLPLMVIIEYFGHISDSWSFPQSIFPIRIFGNVILEVLIWVFFNVFYVLMFYEYFLDRHITKHLWAPRMKYLFSGMIILFIAFLFFIFNFSTRPIPYFYFLFGLLVFAVPVILQFGKYWHHKKILVKMLKTAAYFFYLSFTYEILALNYGWWSFPSERFIGWFSIFKFKFPIEELVWWIILFALAVLTYYEYFDDDEK